MEAILSVHARGVKIKKFLDPDVVTIHLLHKGFMEEYLCWYANREPFVPHETMSQRMVETTSSASNVHGVVNNNGNSYRTMIMDTMRMNHGHVNQCSIIYEELNAYATMFFDLLKIPTNHYGMVAQITVNYMSLHRCLPSSRIIS